MQARWTDNRANQTAMSKPSRAEASSLTGALHVHVHVHVYVPQAKNTVWCNIELAQLRRRHVSTAIHQMILQEPNLSLLLLNG
jgi:hypothetical protein